MGRRVLVATGILLAVGGTALSAGSAYAYFWDGSRAHVLAEGVQITGVDVGGLEVDQASRLLTAHFAERLRQPVRLVYGDREFTVQPTKAGVRVEVDRMVAAALHTSRAGGLIHRIARDVRGNRLEESIPISATLSPE